MLASGPMSPAPPALPIAFDPLPYQDRLDARPLAQIDLVVIHCTELPDLAMARGTASASCTTGRGTGNSGHYYIDRDGSRAPVRRSSTASRTTCAATTRARSASNWSTRGRYPRLAGRVAPGDGRAATPTRRSTRWSRCSTNCRRRTAVAALHRRARGSRHDRSGRPTIRREGAAQARPGPMFVDRCWPQSAIPAPLFARRRAACCACACGIRLHRATTCRRPSTPVLPPPEPPHDRPRQRASRSRAGRTALAGTARGQPVPRPEPRHRHQVRVRRAGARTGAVGGAGHDAGAARRAFAARLLPARRRHRRADRLPGRPHARRRQLLRAPRHRDPARRGDLLHGGLVPAGRGRRRAPVVDAGSAEARGHRSRRRRCPST